MKGRSSLVIQSFGRESELKRAVLTVLSFFAYTSEPIENTEVILFTDNPSFFTSYFQGLPVRYRLLTPEKIKHMRGEIDFLHRIKIAIIEEAFSLTNSNLLYADSDTFFIADPLLLMQEVNPGQCYMHLREFEYEHLRSYSRDTIIGKSFRAFLELIETQKFYLANGTQIQYTPRHISWNAGVMMFHYSHCRFIPDVYSLTDQFFPKSQHHASEQFAFSLILQENINIKPCNSVIYHYWYRIKKEIVDLFLKDKLSMEWSKLSLSEKLSDVKGWCNELPECFDKHILMLKDNSIQAFNTNSFIKGYKYFLKAWIKSPFDFLFIKHILYHSKRAIKSL